MPYWNALRLAVLSTSLLLLLAVGNPARADLMTETFAEYQKLLERYLTEKDLDHDGLVSAFDYQAALDDDDLEKILSAQHERLAEFDKDQLDSRERAIAFWNNAYNYFMLAEILKERPDGELVDSVWDYGGRYNPFRDSVFTTTKHDIGGTRYSLDEMEKGMLLGDDFAERGWKDARVHFTVNCASVGCPPLRKTIYTEDNIDDLLAENTRRAFNTERQLRVDGRTLYLTQLFDWYEDHFEDAAGSVRDFIREHADDRIVDMIEDTSRIRHIDYDWALNSKENFSEFD